MIWCIRKNKTGKRTTRTETPRCFGTVESALLRCLSVRTWRHLFLTTRYDPGGFSVLRSHTTRRPSDSRSIPRVSQSINLRVLPADSGRVSSSVFPSRCFPSSSPSPLFPALPPPQSLRRPSRIPSVSPGRPRTFRTFRLDLGAPRDAVGELTFQE